jgi:uncharacterized membrane protein YeaQ/YmgE (transglycosylase-associated protein family)
MLQAACAEPKAAVPAPLNRLSTAAEQYFSKEEIMGLIIFLCIGALAGWIAGRLMKGSGFGLLGNMAVGIIGAVIGGWTFSQLGISVANGFVGSLVTSVAGASILLFAVGLFKK